VEGVSELQDELRATARAALAADADPVALGWTGIEVPEALGGAGATFAETAVVLHELGRVASDVPFLGTVLAVGALLEVEADDRRDELLAGIAAGDLRATLAVDRFVPDAAEADVVLVVDGGRLAVAEVGVRPVALVDETRAFAEVAVTRTTHTWPFAGNERAALAVALDSVGLAEAVLEQTVAYAKERQQFGQPIGSFQAVKHQLADVAVELALSRQLVADAVRGEVPVSMAKVHATETAVRATGTAIQLHGGIGYTWEHGLHRYLKRATLNRDLFGSPAVHRARLAAGLTASRV
jgi:alkylation response protein AidB-like acyl-CoA dehydrogenase